LIEGCRYVGEGLQEKESRRGLGKRGGCERVQGGSRADWHIPVVSLAVITFYDMP
jgi:hypothetical protein